MTEYTLKVVLALAGDTPAEVHIERVTKFKVDSMTGALLIYISSFAPNVPAVMYSAAAWLSVDVEGVAS